MKNKNQDIRIFVIFSLSLFALVIIGMFLAALTPLFTEPRADTNKLSERYFFKDIDLDDPYLNKVPNFEDYLAGPIISANDPYYGNNQAKAVIVMFSDFSCSYCKAQEKLVKQAFMEYKDKIMFMWKDFPESDMESLSYKAAVAGRCAQEQGYFWEYHSRLYADNGLNEARLLSAAENIGLEMDDFRKCQRSDRARQLVNDNIEEANALDLSGVPFVYVNDQELFGSGEYEDLKRLIEVELTK